jgi:hypothetical protein
MKMAIQRYNGRGDFGYDYYHSEECQPETMIKGSGIQWPIALSELTDDCKCAGCSGNIHEPPVKMDVPVLTQEYEVWRDAQNCRHFRVKGSADDMLLKGWYWEDDDPNNKHRGMVFIRRYDVINRKHKAGYCSPNHPLVVALGLEKP